MQSMRISITVTLPFLNGYISIRNIFLIGIDPKISHQASASTTELQLQSLDQDRSETDVTSGRYLNH